jgi:putative aldouronate transport system substrate-binding protein
MKRNVLKKVIALALTVSLLLVPIQGMTVMASEAPFRLSISLNEGDHEYDDLELRQELYRWIEEYTNTEIEWWWFGWGHNDQLTLMLASGDLPDMIHWNWLNYGPTRAIEEGHIIRLNELMEEHAHHFLSRYHALDDVTQRLVPSVDGDFYVFPYLTTGNKGGIDNYTNVFGGPIIRMDWLELLGLDVPETIDDWYDVLTAFVVSNPNGNRASQEVGLIPHNGGAPFMYDAFIGAYGLLMGYFQRDGEVVFGPAEPEYRDFLTEMNRWFVDGLLHPEYNTVSGRDGLEAQVRTDTVGAFVGLSSDLNRATGWLESDVDVTYWGIPYPVLNSGDIPQIGQIRFGFGGVGTAITTNSSNVELAVKWLDYQYSIEGNRLMTFGIEGLTYEFVNGEPQLTQGVFDGTVRLNSHSMTQIGGPFIQLPELYVQQGWAAANPINHMAVLTWTLPEYPFAMPPLTFTQEESELRSPINGPLNAYRAEMMNKFVRGEEPLSIFDQYVAELYRMGLETMVETQQAALDRFLRR